jgi:hypothetical protein
MVPDCRDTVDTLGMLLNLEGYDGIAVYDGAMAVGPLKAGLVPSCCLG